MRRNNRLDNDIKRVKKVQGIRYSSAADPVPSASKYDRNRDRKLLQRRQYDKIED